MRSGVHDAIYRQYIHALAGEFARRAPDFRGLGQLIEGAGHWVQFEAPEALTRRCGGRWRSDGIAGSTPAAGREGRETVAGSAVAAGAWFWRFSGSGAQQASASSYLICSDWKDFHAHVDRD